MQVGNNLYKAGLIKSPLAYKITFNLQVNQAKSLQENSELPQI